MDGHLVCEGGAHFAHLLYLQLGDTACERIAAAITRAAIKTNRPVRPTLDHYPVGSTRHVSFNTSKKTRWRTSPAHCHINWAVCDSDWEAEFCRVAEAHPRVRSYAKNQGLGLEVPYRLGTVSRTYLPDFVVLVDDGRGPEISFIW